MRANRPSTSRRSALLTCSAALLASVLTTAGCATSSRPTPAVAPVIPSPPVKRAPADSQTYLPKVQDWSQRAADWSQRSQTWHARVRALRNSEPQN